MRSNATTGSPPPEGRGASALAPSQASAHLQLAAVWPDAAPGDGPTSPYDENSNVIIERRELEGAGDDGSPSGQSDLDLIAPTLESSIAPAAGPGAGSPGTPTPDPDGEPDNGSLSAFNTGEPFQFLEFGTGSGGPGTSFADSTVPVIFDPAVASSADLTLLQVIVSIDDNGVIVLDTGPQQIAPALVASDSVASAPIAPLDGAALAPVIIVPPAPPLPAGVAPPPVVLPPKPPPTNGPPTANDDSFSTSEITVELGGSTLGNVILTTPGQDSDPDGDGLSVTTVATPVPSGFAAAGVNVTSIVPGTPGLGQAACYIINTSDGTADLVVGIDGTVSLNAVPGGDPFRALGSGETGSFSLSYTIDDGNGGTASAAATVIVNGDNDPPVANPDFFAIGEDAVAPGASNLLGNLLTAPGQDSDPDGDSLTVIDATNLMLSGFGPISGFPIPVSGVAGLFSIGSPFGIAELDVGTDGPVSLNGLTGDPFNALDDGDTGIITFDYTIDDGNGGTGSATATIFVEGDTDVMITTTTLSASLAGLTSSLAAPGGPPAPQSADSLLLEDLLPGSGSAPQTGDGGIAVPVPPIPDSTIEGAELLITA